MDGVERVFKTTQCNKIHYIHRQKVPNVNNSVLMKENDTIGPFCQLTVKFYNDAARRVSTEPNETLDPLMRRFQL